jgi:hypothetical protein
MCDQDGEIEVRTREVGALMYRATSHNCTCEIPAPVLQADRGSEAFIGHEA